MPGDAFLFKPGEPHQIVNHGATDMIVCVIADNPIGESSYYPDSQKWGAPLPERRRMRGESLDYFDGEEYMISPACRRAIRRRAWEAAAST